MHPSIHPSIRFFPLLFEHHLLNSLQLRLALQLTMAKATYYSTSYEFELKDESQIQNLSPHDLDLCVSKVTTAVKTAAKQVP